MQYLLKSIWIISRLKRKHRVKRKDFKCPSSVDLFIYFCCWFFQTWRLLIPANESPTKKRRAMSSDTGLQQDQEVPYLDNKTVSNAESVVVHAESVVVHAESVVVHVESVVVHAESVVVHAESVVVHLNLVLIAL